MILVDFSLLYLHVDFSLLYLHLLWIQKDTETVDPFPDP